LCGRPPFRGTTVLDTLQQVQKAEPVAPTRLQPKVPLDLQTICLKSLEKDPAKRYPTAQAMADDLQCFLEGRPIQARPTPAWERAFKWARRNPAAATVYATIVMSIIGLFAIGAFYNRQLSAAYSSLEIAYTDVKEKKDQLDEKRAELQQANQNLDAKNQQLDQEKKVALDAKYKAELARSAADEARKKEAKARQEADEREAEAQASFLQVQNAVDQLLKVAYANLKYTPGAEAVRQDLLRDAAKMAQRFVDTRRESPIVVLRSARALRMVGDVSELMGKSGEALKNYELAIAQLDRLLKDARDKKEGEKTAALEKELIDVYLNLWIVVEKAEPARAAAVLELARRFLEEASTSHKHAELYQWYRACLLNNQGIHLHKQYNIKEALTAYEQSEQLLKELLKKSGRSAYRLELAKVEVNRGALWTGQDGKQSGAYENARKAYDVAIDQLEPLLNDQPDPAYAKELGRAYINKAVLLRSHKEPYDDVYKKAIGIFDVLVKNSPRVPDYQHLLATAHTSWGEHLLQDGRFTDARQHLTQARTLLDKLAKGFSDVPEYREELARCCIGQGVALAFSREAAAREPLEKAYRLLEGLHRLEPDNGKYQDELEKVMQNLILFYSAEQKKAEASAQWEKADEFLAQATLLKEKKATDYLERARRHADEGKHREAAAALKRFFEFAPLRWARVGQGILVLGRCTTLAHSDEKLSQAQRDELARDYGKQTLARLRIAQKQGVEGLGDILAAPELEKVRGRSEFAQEIEELRTTLAPRRPPAPR
jgi:tetratricopeptide (TPR) repeat protein